MNNEEKILGLLETLVVDVSGLKEDVSGLKQDVSNLQKDMIDVKAAVVRIENDHGKRLDSLYDGFVANQENLVRVEGKLDRLADKNAEEHLRTQAAIMDLAKATKINTSDIARLKAAR